MIAKADYMIDIQICFPGKVEGVEDGLFGFVTPHSMLSNSSINFSNKRTSDKHKVYEQGESAGNDKWRRVTIEYKHFPSNVMVYELSLPYSVRPAPWSKWKSPDFIQTGEDARWHVMRRSKDGHLPPPSDAPKIRYRVIDKYDGIELR